MSTDLEQLTLEIGRWTEKVFHQLGASLPTPEELTTRIEKELKELKEDIRSNSGNVAAEVADVLITMLALCHLQGISPTQAIQEKMAVNVNRTWRPASSGYIQHISDDEISSQTQDQDPIPLFQDNKILCMVHEDPQYEYASIYIRDVDPVIVLLSLILECGATITTFVNREEYHDTYESIVDQWVGGDVHASLRLAQKLIASSKGFNSSSNTP